MVLSTKYIALLIGINYKGTSSELNGCINDVKSLKNHLMKRKKYKNTNIITMTDDSPSKYIPTKHNIQKQLRWLVNYSKKYKNRKVKIFVSYSGHGSNLRDRSGDELDGRDEVLCPLDYDKNGFITDDYLKKYFVDRLPRNAKVAMLVDACHSGTVLDLKYNYLLDSKGTKIVYDTLKIPKCKFVMLSGSTDAQTSSDAYIDKKFQGAMTASYLKNYNKNISYKSLVKKMRYWLKKNGFSQIPQLSSSRRLNVYKKHTFVNY